MVLTILRKLVHTPHLNSPVTWGVIVNYSFSSYGNSSQTASVQSATSDLGHFSIVGKFQNKV